MRFLPRLFENNRSWAAARVAADPDFFERLCGLQAPEHLWIGCADSRVPANEIVGLAPGELFVHRNIANVVAPDDSNCLSVLQYAIDVLKIKHIIVCGHYGCGGIKAALQPQSSNLVITNKWLMHIKDLYRLHQDELDAISPEKKIDRLIEINIVEQVYRIAHTSIVQAAWKHNQMPSIHGWVYGLNDGLINELITLDYNHHINPVYRYVD